MMTFAALDAAEVVFPKVWNTLRATWRSNVRVVVVDDSFVL